MRRLSIVRRKNTKRLLVFGLVLAISMCSKIVAQQISPNTIPARSSKTGSSVKKLQSQKETDGSENADSSKSKIPTCDQTSPCYAIEQPQTKTEAQKANDESLDRLYRRSLWAAIFGVIGAFVGLAVLIWQTVLTRQAANAAKSSADSTARQTEALITGQRAFIVVDTGDVPDSFDHATVGALDVKPLIRNNGRTPGWIKRGYIRYLVVPQGSKLPPEPDYSGDLAKKEVYAIIPSDAYIQPLHETIPFSEFIPIRQGNGTLYVYGFVDYNDFARKERQTRFCLVYHVPHGFDSQTRGWYVEINAPRTYLQST